MSEIPGNLLYTAEHEWARDENGGLTVGITWHAQSQLGDVTYAQLPAKGTTVTRGQTFGVVESVKAVSDLYAPVTGTVMEVNGSLNASPEVINKDPYGKGWMIRIQPTRKDEIKELLSPDQYKKLTGH